MGDGAGPGGRGRQCKGIFIFPFPFVSAVFYTCLLSRVWVSGVLLLTHFTIVIS